VGIRLQHKIESLEAVERCFVHIGTADARARGVKGGQREGGRRGSPKRQADGEDVPAPCRAQPRAPRCARLRPSRPSRERATCSHVPTPPAPRALSRLRIRSALAPRSCGGYACRLSTQVCLHGRPASQPARLGLRRRRAAPAARRKSAWLLGRGPAPRARPPGSPALRWPLPPSLASCRACPPLPQGRGRPRPGRPARV
jgi:hypothetical protein